MTITDGQGRERVTLVIALFNQLALTRGCLESLRTTTEPFRLVVIDNGSTDGTRELFRAFPYPYPLHVIENDDNRSVIASLNRAWPAVETELLCFLHNDTEMIDPAWLSKLVRALDDPTVGMSGLFGAKRMRRGGRFVGELPEQFLVRSFEPAIVVTKTGGEQMGLLRKDTPEEILLATGPATEARIPRADISELRPGTVSPMPPGIEQMLTPQELADLIAFLKATRG